MAYSTQHVTNEIRYQILKGGGVGAWRCRISIALSPHHRLSIFVTLPIHGCNFFVWTNLDAHPTSRFGKTVCCIFATPKVDHKNKWESNTNGQILRCWSHCNFVSKIWSDRQHCLQKRHILSHHNWQFLALHMPGFHKNGLSCFEGEREMGFYKHLYYVFMFLCKVDYNSAKFIHAPMHVQWGHVTCVSWHCRAQLLMLG